MSADSADKERVLIHISEALNLSEREDLVARLENQLGIDMALFDPYNAYRLTIDYQPEHFSHITLLDFMALHKVHGHVVGGKSQ